MLDKSEIMDMTPIHRYESLLEKFPVSAPSSLLQAFTIAMANKVARNEKIDMINGEEITCVKRIFSSAYGSLISSKKLGQEDVVRLEALGFWLMHHIDNKKEFCKVSHFWPGYIQ